MIYPDQKSNYHIRSWKSKFSIQDYNYEGHFTNESPAFRENAEYHALQYTLDCRGNVEKRILLGLNNDTLIDPRGNGEAWIVRKFNAFNRVTSESYKDNKGNSINVNLLDYGFDSEIHSIEITMDNRGNILKEIYFKTDENDEEIFIPKDEYTYKRCPK